MPTTKSMPPKKQNQNSSTRLTTGGFANIAVFIILLFTMGGAVVYFKNFPPEKLPAGEPIEQSQVAETKESGENIVEEKPQNTESTTHPITPVTQADLKAARESYKECSIDTDCAPVGESCNGSCNCGDPINKKFVQQYASQLKSYCSANPPSKIKCTMICPDINLVKCVEKTCQWPKGW